MAPSEATGSERDRSEEDGHDGLFQGMSFWLSENVPQKRRFRELIQVCPQRFAPLFSLTN
jgi:telomeric repeat-binding factor 2-interacting protein 1